ncbi:hypothetical protein IM774_05190 [Erysipelotrichaceae bacterium RD49]|nr:hypothetical protein [Erysipelotrichaceae bacterium RD49]
MNNNAVISRLNTLSIPSRMRRKGASFRTHTSDSFHTKQSCNLDGFLPADKEKWRNTPKRFGIVSPFFKFFASFAGLTEDMAA